MDSDTTMHGFIAQKLKMHSDTAGLLITDVGIDKIMAEGALIEAMVILVKAVQELSAENEALSARITALES